MPISTAHSRVPKAPEPTVMTRSIRKLLAVSAVFLLGSAQVQAASCATQGHASAASAEMLLRANDSKMAYGSLQRGWDRPFGEADPYPDGWKASAGESYRKGATMFEQGRGVEANADMARHLNWMGAQYHDADAMYRTAVNFFDRGYRKDGWEWAERAKDCGSGDAVVLLIERSIQENKTQEALKYLELGIDMGLPQAKFLLAEQYDKGALGLPKDYQRAFNWYYLAAKDGVTKAMIAVAYYFVRGNNGMKDDLAAIHWYHQAAKAGDVEAMTAYGWMLVNTKSLKGNEEEGVWYLKKAAKMGNVDAAEFLRKSKTTL